MSLTSNNFQQKRKTDTPQCHNAIPYSKHSQGLFASYQLKTPVVTNMKNFNNLWPASAWAIHHLVLGSKLHTNTHQIYGSYNMSDPFYNSHLIHIVEIKILITAALSTIALVCTFSSYSTQLEVKWMFPGWSYLLD